MTTTLGIYLRELRQNAGFTVEDVAKKLDVPASLWTAIEHDQLNAEKRVLLKAADFFKQPESNLLDRSVSEKITREARKVKLGYRKSALLRDNEMGTRRLENLQHSSSTLKTIPFIAKFFAPPPTLQPMLECIVYCHQHNLGQPFERVFPDGANQLIISLGKSTRTYLLSSNRDKVFRTALVGIQQVPVTSRISGEGGTMYIRFKPGGLYAMMSVNYQKLHRPVVDGRQLFTGISFEHVLDRLDEASSAEETAKIMFDFLEGNIKGKGRIDPVIQFFLDNASESLATLKSQAKYSPKYLAVFFKKHMGMTPKLLQRVKRFNAVISDLNASRLTPDFASLVFKHSYHDQAHLIKEFREFSGWSPEEFLAMGAGCSKYVHFT